MASGSLAFCRTPLRRALTSSPAPRLTPPANEPRNHQQARTFFSLKDIAKLAGEVQGQGANAGSRPGSGQAAGVTEYKDSKVLRYSSSELYKIVSDVNSYSSFLPFCAGSTIKGPAPPLEGDALATSDKVTSRPDHRVLADLTVGFKSFKETYTSVVEMKENEWVAATALPHPLFQHLSTRWTFHPLPDGSSTRIDFSLDYAFSSPIYSALAGGIFKELSTKMMNAFEERAVEVYGQK
ncbi:hypothetical protein BCV69DRAFT_103874 [Microstroma glucosiphilum]|uniref:Coenzyme Q-binding protein COQ10 START domain-containing protein n=1 Tax=Pseudomicrostroma glucosiphilum TaxID=1684307 RepID=A0A316UDL2_9BASI|nr:hypothetical protein BCV69DRAFT_103874 [Pseudomicrostroma glucosiphilum]PWN22978.1 hypothetical protein BCV69DRAFT_103874 [Pseudomicrostroma glucosiphilum]